MNGLRNRRPSGHHRHVLHDVLEHEAHDGPTDGLEPVDCIANTDISRWISEPAQ